EVLPHPRDAGELSAVGDLVQGQPEAELAGRESEALLEGDDVGTDVVDDVLLVGLIVLYQQEVVLAEDPRGHPTEQRAHLGAGDGPGDRCEGAGTQPLAEAVGDGPQEAAEGGDVGPHPAVTVGDPG